MAADRYCKLGSSTEVRIGRGSYANVVPCWDTQAGRLVAVKIQKRKSDTAVREMMFFQTLPGHPHVLPVLDVIVHGDELKLVFEYCQASLRDWYKRAQGFLNFDVSRQCARHVLEGLRHLHQNDIAHRDLSMGNILMSEGGSWKIADLGLSVCASDFVMTRQVQTPGFRAPEACVDFATLPYSQSVLDMWSFGVLVVALWTGSAIFQAMDEDLKKQNRQTLKKIASFLGSPRNNWPEVSLIPEWKADLEALADAGPSSLRTKLLCAKVVHRPLASPMDEALLDFIGSLLTWNPELRKSAASALEDHFWDTSSLGKRPEAAEGSKAQSPTSSLTIGTPGSIGSGTVVSPESQQSVSAGGSLREERRCRCSANCSHRECLRNKARARKDGTALEFHCYYQAMVGSRNCEICTCFMQGCRRPCQAVSTERRLCKGHLKEVGTTIFKTHYVCRTGKKKFQAAWNWELRMVATHAWLLQHMCPMDIKAFLEAADSLAGGALTGHLLLQLWAAAVLKLPQAVEAWVKALETTRPPKVLAGCARAPKSYSSAVVSMMPGVAPADPWQYAQLQTGNQHFWFGVPAFISKLKMSQGCKRKMGAGGEEGDDAEEIRQVVQSEEEWDKLVELADSFDEEHVEGLPWPQNAKDVKNMISEISGWLAKFPVSWGLGVDDNYVKKHVLRKFSMWLQTKSPAEAWTGLTLQEVLASSPDKKKHLKSLPAAWTAQNLETCFGLNALMVPCWACLFHEVPEKDRSAFEAPDPQLLAKVMQIRKERGGYEPNLKTLASMMNSD